SIEGSEVGSIDGCRVSITRQEGARGGGAGRARLTVRRAKSPGAGARAPDPRGSFIRLAAQRAGAFEGGLWFEGDASEDELASLTLDMVSLCSVLGAEVLSEVVAQPKRSQERPLALEYLLAAHPYSSCRAAVMTALGSGDPALERMAVAAAARARDAASFDAIAALGPDASDEVAAAIAAALPRLGGARAEPALMALLSRRSREVRRAAAMSLAGVGTAAAVEPLLAIDSPESRHAIELIQARIGGERGLISLAAGAVAEGQLSFPDGPEGALSIAPKAKA
ncbi:MAG TPA: HEAT repeat domain-containing protein, partial [Myxococcales bacterium]|nr:HEAT repeat domain-containing protein [Myxococcales bacterium]